MGGCLGVRRLFRGEGGCVGGCFGVKGVVWEVVLGWGLCGRVVWGEMVVWGEGVVWEVVLG